MKKITAKQVRTDAQKNLLVTFFIFLLSAWALMYHLLPFPYSWVMVGSVLLMVPEGYRSLRLLRDESYLKAYLIKRNDERNIQLENLALRQVFKIMWSSYIFLVNFLSIWIGQWIWIFIGFGLLGFVVYYLAKWHYMRQL